MSTKIIIIFGIVLVLSIVMSVVSYLRYKQKKQNNNVYYLVVMILSLSLSLISGVSMIYVSSNSSNIYYAKSSNKTTAKETKDSISAVDSLTNLLNNMNVPKKGKTLEETAAEFDIPNGDVRSYIQPEVLDSIYVWPQIKEEEKASYYTNVASILWGIISELPKDKNGKIVPHSDMINSIDKYMLIDTKNGIASIPLSLYTEQPSIIRIVMFYSDGKWKLEPNNLVESVMGFTMTSNRLQNKENHK